MSGREKEKNLKSLGQVLSSLWSLLQVAGGGGGGGEEKRDSIARANSSL